jgi:hypothetical protein
MRADIQRVRDMEPTFEQMARLLAESGDYRVASRLRSLAEYHAPG